MNDEKWAAWAMQTSRTWNDVKDVLKYTNIDFIDHDHRMLIEYALDLNLVIDEAQKNFSMQMIMETKKLLNRFYDYAVDHFHREEIFMDLYDLPEIEAHKYEHNRILGILRRALNDFENGKVKVSVKLKMQVMEWLVRHVNVIDYNFFDLENWSQNLVRATSWEEIKPIIHLTGIPEIDHQHMVLTNQAIELMACITNDCAAETIDGLFKKFIEYADYHFDFENEFMLKYHIPDIEYHLDKHEFFINTMKDYREQAKAKKLDVDNVKSWILTWWIGHINYVDREYFAYENWAVGVIKDAKTIEEVEVVLRRTGIEAVDHDHLALMVIMIELNKEIDKFNAGNKTSAQEGNRIKELKAFIDGHGSVSPEKQREIVLDYLDQAYELAKAHFDREEKIMADRGYADIMSHKKEHDSLLRQLQAMRENFADELLDISSNIKATILEWWIDHTNNTDFRTFVQKNGDLFESGEGS